MRVKKTQKRRFGRGLLKKAGEAAKTGNWGEVAAKLWKSAEFRQIASRRG